VLASSYFSWKEFTLCCKSIDSLESRFCLLQLHHNLEDFVGYVCHLDTVYNFQTHVTVQSVVSMMKDFIIQWSDTQKIIFLFREMSYGRYSSLERIFTVRFSSYNTVYLPSNLLSPKSQALWISSKVYIAPVKILPCISFVCCGP